MSKCFHLTCCTPYDEKPSRISFDKVYIYIEKHGRESYLSLLRLYEKYEQMFKKIKHSIQQKGIIYYLYYLYHSIIYIKTMLIITTP